MTDQLADDQRAQAFNERVTQAKPLAEEFVKALARLGFTSCILRTVNGLYDEIRISYPKDDEITVSCIVGDDIGQQARIIRTFKKEKAS